MGVSVHYWAVPSQSALYARLQRETAFCVLMAALFPYGRGIFYFFEEIDPEEREEILAWVIDRRRGVLGSPSEARRWIDEFRSELKHTRAAYPGIETRNTSLEKTSQLIEERLLQELQKVQGEAATAFLRALMFGDQELGRHLGLAAEGILGLISLAMVREGARVLRQVNPETLFARDRGWEEWHLKDLRRWRQLYQEASATGDVLLVGVC